jgi:SPP1 family predicted phage head-tail adaptor
MPNAIDLGEFRHRVTLQNNEPTESETGQDVAAWSDVGTYSAAITTLSGRELISATQIKSTVNHKVTMRAGPSVQPSDRLLFGSPPRTFVIEVVFRVGEQNQFLELWCSEDLSNR